MYLLKKLSLLLFILIAMGYMPLEAKVKRPVYLFGVATSFQDSTVYITEIQRLDSMTIERKNGLEGVRTLNRQFASYLHKNNQAEYVEVLFYNEKKDKVEKDLLKIRTKYTSSKAYKLKVIPADTFSYFHDTTVVEARGVAHALEGKPEPEE